MNIPVQFGISLETRFVLEDQEVTETEGECRTPAAETREADSSRGIITQNFAELL